MADEHAIWEAIEELKRSTASHAVKHAQIDGFRNYVKVSTGPIGSAQTLPQFVASLGLMLAPQS